MHYIIEKVKKELKVYITALMLVIISECIGTISFQVGWGKIVLFPMLFALIMAVILGPELVGFFKLEDCKAASTLVLIAITPFMAKLGILAGGNISKLVALGPALILQEFGNLGTMFLSIPVALLLGMKREAIGACYSINRETNLGLSIHAFGPDSPETRGTFAIYIIGSVIGTVYMGFLASLLASTNLFHPWALGMACGVGSGSMMAAATTTLAHIYPEYANDIFMLGGASDMLTGIDGIYMGMFIGIPLAVKLYEWLEPKIGIKKDRGGRISL